MRGSNKEQRHVGDKIAPAFLTAQPQPVTFDSGFPTADVGIKELILNWAGTFNTSGASGSPVADGALKLLRVVNLKTNKHKNIFVNMDGLGLHRLMQFAHKTRGAVVDCATNADGTTFNAQLRVPFADKKRLARPHDAIIDMGSNAIMDLKIQPGVVTDVQSAGTNGTVNGLRFDVDVEVIDGLESVNDPETVPALTRRRSELPNWLPVWEKGNAVAASAGKVRIPIPCGDRVIRRIALAQMTVDPTTGRQTEVSSIVASTGTYTLKIGKDVIVEPVTHQVLNGINKDKFEVESMPAGWAVLDFDEDQSVARMLDMYQYSSGLTAYVEVDVLTVSNGFLIPYFEYFQIIPDDAVRKVA